MAELMPALFLILVFAGIVFLLKLLDELGRKD